MIRNGGLGQVMANGSRFSKDRRAREEGGELETLIRLDLIYLAV